MGVNVEPFWLQKAGCAELEYEDAFYPPPPSLSGVHDSFRDGWARFAVADGATDSSYSGLWAKLLVRAFVESNEGEIDVEPLLGGARSTWSEHVGQKQLPWYGQERILAGAFSSLLGLAIQESDPSTGLGAWRAVAIGDSCLVQVRGERILTRFPIDHSSAFDSGPFLLSTNPRSDVDLAAQTASQEGDAQIDDAFYLMTDALACWFMSEDERGQAPWQVLRDLNTSDQRESFSELIGRLRIQGAIRNDDCTLLRIDIV